MDFNSSKNILRSGEIEFSAEGRLLQELGERLVVSSDLAITELIKNAYDADSSKCTITFSDDSLIIEDEGCGMAFDDFKNKWMRIATSSKQGESQSSKYKRTFTGAKGIGRFAVRFLGEELELITIAYDKGERKYTRLEASFKWKDIDKLNSLIDSKVPYKVFLLEGDIQTGTQLIIRKLKPKVIDEKNIKSNILKVVSPIYGLERGKFSNVGSGKLVDPGFNVIFEKKTEGEESIELELSGLVLDNYWAKLRIELDNDILEYKINFNYPISKNESSKTFKLKYANHISNGVFADLRFFPRRAGIFQGKGFDGTEAWEWIRNNSGVAVIDHGFRIKPYGFKDDDWLNLNRDTAYSERKWQTNIMREHFEMSDEQLNQPSLNPMINLANNHQLVGAVFVLSKQRGKDNDDLIPAMDREGFISNLAFHELQEVVRAGIEYLALKDREEELKKDELKIKEATRDLKKNFRSAIESIEKDETISSLQKAQIINSYNHLAKEIENVDEYNKKARENLEIISLLGVVSGFMTHESHRILSSLKVLSDDLKNLVKKDPSLRSEIERVEKAISEINGQLAYSSMFISSIHNNVATRFKAKPQVDLLIDRFGDFAKRRDIEHIIDIDPNLLTPNIMVHVYSGIILNLYTNAVKAVLMKNNNETTNKILIRIWNLTQKHIIEVADNGIGIPESFRERIWDPLFTTTSKLNSPLGSGMGLGLSIVKKTVKDSGGNIRLVDPPSDFVTCFRVEFPRT